MDEGDRLAETKLNGPEVENPTLEGPLKSLLRGSLSSSIGQVAVLLASLAATPFVIRALGSEAYGAIAFVNLVFGFAALTDLGMNQASTKFSAEAHSSSDCRRESSMVWSSVAVLALPTLGCSFGIYLASGWIVDNLMSLSPNLHSDVRLGLQITALAWIPRALSGVFNTPQLVRMRLGLFHLINSGTLVLQIIAIPIVLHFGGGLRAAFAIPAIFALLSLALNFIVSSLLLPELLSPAIDRNHFKAMARFGLATTTMAVIGVALFNGEKLILTRLVSVKALAYYSVAFTLARMSSILPAALSQPALPSFSRLSAESERAGLSHLYFSSLRWLIIALLPIIACICACGKSFLAIWVGSEFAHASSNALLILAIGCFLDGLSYIPRLLLSAKGRPDVIVRCQLVSVLPYIPLAVWLIRTLGIEGAALAWSLRAIVEGVLVFSAAREFVAPPPNFMNVRRPIFMGGLTLALPLSALPFAGERFVIMFPLFVAAAFAYAALIWREAATPAERVWLCQLRRRCGWQIESGPQWPEQSGSSRGD